MERWRYEVKDRLTNLLLSTDTGYGSQEEAEKSGLEFMKAKGLESECYLRVIPDNRNKKAKKIKRAYEEVF